MREAPAGLDALQRLPDRSRARAAGHLRGIINERRALSAADITCLLTGMKVVALATVAARGEPRMSAVDGHILTYAAHQRILAAGALNDAGHTDLDEDPVRWIPATALPDPRQ